MFYNRKKYLWYWIIYSNLTRLCKREIRIIFNRKWNIYFVLQGHQWYSQWHTKITIAASIPGRVEKKLFMHKKKIIKHQQLKYFSIKTAVKHETLGSATTDIMYSQSFEILKIYLNTY